MTHKERRPEENRTSLEIKSNVTNNKVTDNNVRPLLQMAC